MLPIWFLHYNHAERVLLHPVHNLQVRYPFKLPGVMRNHRIPPGQPLGGDLEIVRPDGHPRFFQLAADFAGSNRVIAVEGEDGKRSQEQLQHVPVLFRPLAPGRPVFQLIQSNC